MSEVKEAIDRDDEMREGNDRTLASFSFSSAFNAAAAVKRASFSCFYLERYLFNSLNNCVTVFLSSVCENWATAGPGWDLETLVQNDLLPLEADIFRPFDERGEVSLGSDVLA